MGKPMTTESQGTVKEMRVQEALREALRYEMARDSRVFVMGEDVALFGGAYGVTRGLLQEFGENRVLDTPISESALVGLAVGAAINGMRPVVEIQFADLLPLAMDQLASHAARYHYMTGGRVNVPMVVRNKFATRAGGGPSHSSCNHGAFIHFPGLKIIMPTTPADAKGLLLAAIRDPNPVLCFESHHLYGSTWPGAGRRLYCADRHRRGAASRKGPDDRYLWRYGVKSRCRGGAA